MTSFEEDRQEIVDFLELQPSAVREDCKIISSADINQGFMLRIDKNPPSVFYPNMPKSAMVTENTNTPRITVAPTLVGCMIGYFRIERDVQDGTAMLPGQDRPKFSGGYSISKLEFNHCLKPGNKMVIDSESSDEHWIVPYSEEYVEMEPAIIGQIFVDAVTYIPRSGHHPGVRLEMLLQLDDDSIELPIIPGRSVKKGHYRYSVSWENIRTRTVRDQQCLTVLEEISQEEYLRLKGLRAAMLSYEQPPAFTKW